MPEPRSHLQSVPDPGDRRAPRRQRVEGFQGEVGSFPYRGFHVSYEIRGEGDRPFVLIHGLLLPSWINGAMGRLLAERGNKVILLDLIGHGRSDKPDHAKYHRMELAAEQVVALMDHLGLDEAVVGGLSLGANVSLQVAVAAPERVRGLVPEMPVLERGTIGAMLTLFPLLLALRYGGPVTRWIFALGQRIPRTSNEPFNAVLDTGGNPREMAAVMHGYTAGPVCPPEPQRRLITAPTLVIGHPRDWMHPLDDAKALIEELPNARLLEARSFFEVRMSPQRVVSEIAAFLDEVWGAEAAATR